MLEKQEKEEPIIKLLKVVFTIIAVISIFAVMYNIGIYTDDGGTEAFNEIEQKL